VILPLLVAFNFPLSTTPEVQQIFSALDGLQPGDPVLIAADFDPASKAELLPMLDAVLAHCFIKGYRPTVITLWPAAPRLLQTSVEAQAEIFGKTNGVDFAFLGYRPGNAAVVQGVVDGITNTYATDYYGDPTANLAALQGVRQYGDYKFFIDIAAGQTVATWLAYAAGKHRNVPMAVSCTAVSAAEYSAYLRTGQIIGLAAGMKGSAEYEKLLRSAHAPSGEVTPAGGTARPMPAGTALQGMDAQSMVHIFIVLTIIVSNIIFFIKRRSDGGLSKRRSA
jgi:hypothetical protein